jgi:four helix bundle protein
MKYDQIEDLRIFKLAEEMADRVWSIAIKWGYFERDTIGKQLVRAADSIGANIAEGYGRHHTNDNLRFLFIARGSLQETKVWLLRAYKRKLLKPEDYEQLITLANNLAPQLNAFIRAKRGG